MIVRLNDSVVEFPPYHMALNEPDGLIAVGAKLSPEWLIAAYRNGIFPWFNDDNDEILWWCPSNRAVMVPGEMKISKSLKKTLRSGKFEIKADYNFIEIINLCASSRNLDDTWITKNMIEAYCKLYELGISHSIGVYEEGKLVGGLYGISIGKLFCGESMFHLSRDASKVAFHSLQKYLKEHDYDLIDCQIMNPHLKSLGVHSITREEFLIKVKINSNESINHTKWVI